jgi:hypothetical protein
MGNSATSILRTVHREYWAVSSDVSGQTKRANAITKLWQNQLVAIDPNRYIAEYPVSGYKIDLVDVIAQTAYELKVSPNNPHHEFYRDVFKVQLANHQKPCIKHFVFCCPQDAYTKLGVLGKFVEEHTRLGFSVSFFIL